MTDLYPECHLLNRLLEFPEFEHGGQTCTSFMLLQLSVLLALAYRHNVIEAYLWFKAALSAALKHKKAAEQVERKSIKPWLDSAQR